MKCKHKELHELARHYISHYTNRDGGLVALRIKNIYKT